MPIFLLVFVAFAASSCKKEKIKISNMDVWFSPEGGVQTIQITSMYGWKIAKNDDAEWFTVSPLNAEASDSILTIVANPLDASASGYRSSSISVLSPKGGVKLDIQISQGEVEFRNIFNMVFGVKKEEQWNTDYFGNIIEDSYKCVEFNPNDTTTGFWMYFFEDSTGVQVDRYHQDTAIYYLFNYVYDIAERRLDISFESVDGSPESYSPSVVVATPEVFCFEHEYKPHFWERSNMKKIGTIDPGKKVMMRNRAIKKRKGNGPIFRIK